VEVLFIYSEHIISKRLLVNTEPLAYIGDSVEIDKRIYKVYSRMFDYVNKVIRVFLHERRQY
jgi:hypothetical protein